MDSTRSIILFVFTAGVIVVGGCSRRPAKTHPVAEGIIFSVEYRLEDGKTGGFTRLNSSAAVLGGNGSWNVDAKGVLTRDFLIIKYPQQKELGPRVIPAHRLLDNQFGDGDIKKVGESQPVPAKQ